MAARRTFALKTAAASIAADKDSTVVAAGMAAIAAVDKKIDTAEASDL